MDDLDSHLKDMDCTKLFFSDLNGWLIHLSALPPPPRPACIRPLDSPGRHLSLD
ncbi:MAG: hypothetical protein JEZ12_01760 [Desulfobacterium sp.]|nr:hypothetical protein [Desulfobacterium sp.]